MKNKIILASLLIVSCSTSAFSQNKAFQKGGAYVSLGYGYPNTMRGVVVASAAIESLFGSNTNSVTVSNINASNAGPVIARLEYGISDKFGMGLVLANNRIMLTRDVNGLMQTGTDIVGTPVYRNKDYTEKYAYNSFSIGLRPTFHFMKREKLDMSLGIGAGYSFVSMKAIETFPNSTPITLKTNIPVYFSVTYGIKYYFTPSFGAYAEIGYDKSSLCQAGLAFKLQ